MPHLALKRNGKSAPNINYMRKHPKKMDRTVTCSYTFTLVDILKHSTHTERSSSRGAWLGRRHCWCWWSKGGRRRRWWSLWRWGRCTWLLCSLSSTRSPLREFNTNRIPCRASGMELLHIITQARQVQFLQCFCPLYIVRILAPILHKHLQHPKHKPKIHSLQLPCSRLVLLSLYCNPFTIFASDHAKAAFEL